MKSFKMVLTPPLRAISAAFILLLFAMSAAADFAYRAELTVTGYSGSTTLQNFPVLVRLSPDRINGFRYTRCQPDGKDILFTSPDGETVYPHEIDTWNPDGESLVWVNVPALSGTDTKMIFWFGDATVTAAPVAKSTWSTANGSKYMGVWHMGEEATAETAASVMSLDSAEAIDDTWMDATPLAGKKGDLSGDLTEMVSLDGPVGNGRQNGLHTYYIYGNALVANTYNVAYGSVNPITVSGWFNVYDAVYSSTLVSAKAEGGHSGFWIQATAANNLCIYGGTATTISVPYPGKGTGWFHMAVVFDGTTATCYTNGVLSGSGTVGAANGASRKITFGNVATGTSNPLDGAYDEIRLLGSAASADWVRAEYDQAVVDDYIAYGKAVRTSGEDSLVIVAEDEQYAADLISPTYGKITDFSAPIQISAPDGDVAVSDALKVAFTGWELYRMDDDGAWVLVDSASTNALRYVHEDGTNDKFVWKTVRKRALTLVASPTGSGTFTVNGEATAAGTTVWLPEQATLTVVAVPTTGYDFMWWGGSHQGEQDPTLVVPFDSGESVSLEAVFLSNGSGHEPVTVGTKVASGSWMEAATWEGDAVPQSGDTVYVTNVSLVLNMPLPRLAKLVVDNATLTLSNWLTRVQADVIEVGSKGAIQIVGGFFDGEMSNRVWLVGNDLTVASGGKICADNAGYSCYSGPCWASVKARGAAIGREACGVYGGAYSGQPVANPPSPYGSETEPADPGSGCGELNQTGYILRNRGIGGGAIRLDFTGDVVIDGTVSASVAIPAATAGSGSQYGSGGGVWISCRTISGSGSVAADGGSSTYGGTQTCGGGGRVAVHYDTTAQDAVDCGVAFSARGGLAADLLGARAIVPGETLYHHAYARSGEGHAFITDAGTIWFSDNRFLTSAKHLSGGLRLSGHWKSPVPLTHLEWTGPILATNSFLQLPPGVSLTVNGDLAVGGCGYYARCNNGLAVENASLHVKGNLNVVGARVEVRGGSLTVDGDVTEDFTPWTSTNMKNSRYLGGELAIKAGAADADGCGAHLDIAGTLRISDRCYVCPFAAPLTGSFVKMRAGNVILDEGGRIDADEKGWQVKLGPGAPSTHQNGASHAGLGGSNLAKPSIPETYGKKNRPAELGSGGGSAHTHAGFDGGGLVNLEVGGTFVLNGIVSADGNVRMTAAYAGGSSGGSVYIRAHRLSGTTGKIRAQGGFCAAAKENVQAYGATGGGGRIAVWTAINDWTEQMRAENVTVACGAENGAPEHTFGATDGTVVWRDLGGFLLFLR